MTTTLPATYAEALEAQALRFYKNWILERSGPTGIFGPNGEHIYGRNLMKFWALAHPFGADDIVYLADCGSPEAHEALKELIGEASARLEPPPNAVLAAYNIRIVNGRTPRKSSGPPKAGNFVRDIGIYGGLTALMREFNLKPSPNPAAKMPSACSIAARALADTHIVHLTPKGVEKIWRRYLPVDAGTRFAAGTKFAAGWPADFHGLFGKSAQTHD